MPVRSSQVPWSISAVFTKSLGLKTTLPVVLLALAWFSCWLVGSAERTNHTKSLLFSLTFWSALRLLHSVLFGWRLGSSLSVLSPPTVAARLLAAETNLHPVIGGVWILGPTRPSPFIQEDGLVSGGGKWCDSATQRRRRGAAARVGGSIRVGIIFITRINTLEWTIAVDEFKKEIKGLCGSKVGLLQQKGAFIECQAGECFCNETLSVSRRA